MIDIGGNKSEKLENGRRRKRTDKKTRSRFLL